MASFGITDSTQWMSVNEEALFLHDGLIRVTDLVELPRDVNASQADTENEVVSFDTKDPVELTERLLAVCGKHNNAYAYSRLLEYRLNALKGLWSAHRHLNSNVEQMEREASSHEETIALLKKQGLWQQVEQVSFSSRVGLLLVFPLLRSQRRADPALCGETAELLLRCLRDCPPLSLTKEPGDCLDGLEDLLCNWLGEGQKQLLSSEQKDEDSPVEHQNLASALVALSAARGSIITLIHTVHLLQRLQGSLDSLQVADIVHKLLKLEGGPGCTSSLLGSKHIVCWGFEDMLRPNGSEKTGEDKEKEKDKDPDIGRSVACDGSYLYTTGCNGKGLAKVGSGLKGTLRGFVYSRNSDMDQGWVAHGGTLLVHRSMEMDIKGTLLCNEVNPSTLKNERSIAMPEKFQTATGNRMTVTLCSDGTYFYWVWCFTGADRTGKGQPVYMDMFEIQDQDGTLTATPVKEQKTLTRKDETLKAVGDPLLARIRTYRANPAATLATLTGASVPQQNKEETATTSCGLTLKLLRKTPIYSDGNSIIMITTPPGGVGASGTRSLFGGGPGISGIRTDVSLVRALLYSETDSNNTVEDYRTRTCGSALGTNLCFNIRDGSFANRIDFIDAPTCSVARGSPVVGLGICYDVSNNLIWTCSNDWVDQWHNPGLRAPHHVCQQLGTQPALEGVPNDFMMPVASVINKLLHHIGSNCCHRVHSDLLQSTLAQMLMRQRAVNKHHLTRVCDILDKAIREEDQRIAQCMLIVLQVIFKSHSFSQKEAELAARIGSLMWQLLVDVPKGLRSEGLQREACYAISAGLVVLYPNQAQQNALVNRLLTEGNDNAAIGRLRDLILVDMAEQLRQEREIDNTDITSRLSEDLVLFILRVAVKESSQLIRQCVTADRIQYDTILASVPVASPCMQYLKAYQVNLLREAVLYTEPSAELSPEQQADAKKEALLLEQNVEMFASRCFKGCEEVLEVLLEVCNAILVSDFPDKYHRLQGMERIVKGSVLGYLIPVLITTLTHESQQKLPQVLSLMPRLVQLVILTSQVALLLKAHEISSCQEEGDTISEDAEGSMAELLASQIKEKSNNSKADHDFLAQLKIPAPWATGKTVETIHPVRDNYKFRETVHIPGARCLYLRFDQRCASQYDYDKVVVYAGPGTGSRKVAEYGGNTYGYGSRSVLGSGWPKDLVKVDGNTATFTFEMRSGREHNTPDKAMWGFTCTVRAQESSEDAASKLPFLADLALGLSVLSCTMLHRLYKGPERTEEESMCEHLLKSKLLQRCVWTSEFLNPPTPATSMPLKDSLDYIKQGLPIPLEKKFAPRLKISTSVMKKLKALSGRPAPHLRPSIREVIKPEDLEEAVISATLKHMGLQEYVKQYDQGITLPKEQQHIDVLTQVMTGVFKKVYAMQRQLQTLAELEQRWENDVDEIIADSLTVGGAFFADYHMQENKQRDLELLCYIKGIELDQVDAEDIVKQLKNKLEEHVASKKQPDFSVAPMSKTRNLVAAILQRVELLLHVTIETERPSSPGSLARSVSQIPSMAASGPPFESPSRSPSGPHFTRSVSLPTELESAPERRHDVRVLHGRWKPKKRGPLSLLQELTQGEGAKDKPAHTLLLNDLFAYVGTNPEKTVPLGVFLEAAKTRWHRGQTRQQALTHIKDLLLAASRVGGATHLLAAVTSVLQNGPKVQELACGGMVEHVQQAFSETMTSVVSLAAAHPVACANSIGLLCIIPYTRREEQCLVNSGLVQLLDQLCSLGHSSEESTSAETQSTRQRVSALAWAGFQVLASRCVSWETDESFQNALGYAGLARQVSTLLTNHLARATECSGNEAAGSEALQEVLSLLNNLSRSRMGKAILSQPACVSKLLSLLLDQRPSPKLVLIILQLCRVALPLMSAEDCESVMLPSWGQEVSSLGGEGQQLMDPPAKIASLLLAKLGDYVVPGCQTTASVEDLTSSTPKSSLTAPSTTERDRGEESEAQDGRLSVFIHKRDDQSSHEVIQPLLSSSDGRPFRLGSGANMEKVVRMDREMTRHGKAEVFTDDTASALRKAIKWSQSGLIVSTGPPVDTSDTENGKEKKKVAAEVVCREKNSDLARTDPVRPFISGHVANSMASEVIALLHCLLTAPETHTAQIWASAVERVLSHALSLVSQLSSCQTSHVSLLNNQPHGEAIEVLMSMSRQVVAAFCALGGFRESVKVGSRVQVVGEGSRPLIGQVVSISEPQGIATVHFDIPAGNSIPRTNNTLEVPLSRLQPPSSETLPLQQLSMTERVVSALHNLLLPQEGEEMSPVQVPLPGVGDGSSLAMATCRVMAEIRSRACAVLSLHMREPSFAAEFVKHSSLPLEVLKSLAQLCSPGDRASVVEAQCERLRMLYRDCARPPPPPAKSITKTSREIHWDTSRSFPPARSCLFSHNLTAATFLGEPSAGSGLPRGAICYASQPVPNQAPSFYWELEICSNGDAGDEAGPSVSFGFAPAAERKEGAWTNPVGTVLFHNSGRAVHYSGASLLQWKSIRLDVTLNPGDIVGMGWVRNTEGAAAAPPHGQAIKGHVFITYNGRKLPNLLDSVNGGMWPIVHIQKKNTRVRANFGSHPFAYAEGQNHRDAAVEMTDHEEITANFGALPFHMVEESDNEGMSLEALLMDTGDLTPPGPPCRIVQSPQSLQEYDTEQSVHYKLGQSYTNFPTTGPDVRIITTATQEEDNEDEEGEEDMQEDHHALLVKAWESKVFPVIRRRFRNEAERRSGLEQIKGALQLGMTDIARQTVEFLYEENGGMPRDLHLPTIEDIKAEAAKFTISKVRKGTTVVIRQPENMASSGGTVVPKFAVRGMLKTFGLTGVVLDVDTKQELVQVETYLRSEGVLVRFWYPLDLLERPNAGYRRSSLTGLSNLDISNIHIHRELLRCEAAASRMCCRTALMELLGHCQSPEVIEVIPCSLTSSQAAANPEQDTSHLQLLSNELLASPQPDGQLQANSLLSAQWLHQCLAANTRCMSDIFYREPAALRHEISIAIATAANQGEKQLIELTNKLCAVLQIAPHHFPCEELVVTEGKVQTDMQFPTSAVLVVSCRQDPKTTRKEASLYQAPWARISCYGIGHRVKKSGQTALLEVVSYPADATINSSAGLTAPPSHNIDPYPTGILPCDKVHMKIGVSPVPGYMVSIHGLPSEFPLTMAFLEALMGCYRQKKDSSGKPKKEVNEREQILEKPVHIQASVLARATELVMNYMWHSAIPSVMKEYLFHTLAQLLRLMYKSEVTSNVASASTCLPFTLLTQLQQLQIELKKLFEHESLSSSPLTPLSPGQYSSYFQSLMELCLAVAEITSPPGFGGHLTSPATSVSSAPPSPPPPSQLSPQSAAKRKKIKMRRMGAARRSPRSSESENTDAVEGQGKPEDMLWFHRALTVSLILRHLVDGNAAGLSVTQDAICDAHQGVVSPSNHSRLLVISGIPPTMEDKVIKRAIERACNSHGGLYQGELWIPTQDVQFEVSPDGAKAKLATMQEVCDDDEREKDDSKAKEESAVSSEEVVVEVPKAEAGPQVEQVLDVPSPESPDQPSDSDQQSESSTPKEEDKPLSDDKSSSDGDGDKPEDKQVSKRYVKGYAVVEVRAKSKLDDIENTLLNSKSLQDTFQLEDGTVMDVTGEDLLTISTVNPTLLTESCDMDGFLEYLQQKLLTPKPSQGLKRGPRDVLENIFISCYAAEQSLKLHTDGKDKEMEPTEICLSKEQILSQTPGNLMLELFEAIRSPKKSCGDHVSSVLKQYGVSQPTLKKRHPGKGHGGKEQTRRFTKKGQQFTGKERLSVQTVPSSRYTPVEKKSKRQDKWTGDKKSPEDKADEKGLTLVGFLHYITDKAKEDVTAVWRGILACGYDLHCDCFARLHHSAAVESLKHWTFEMDIALVKYINSLCRKLAVTPARLHPHEVYITESELASHQYSCLQGNTPEVLRLRFALLQSLNNNFESYFIPLADLRPSSTLTQSTAALLSRARGLLFYDTKMKFFNAILDATAQRNLDQAAPEITLDPLETVAGEAQECLSTQFCQAARQLSTVPSSKLCVKIASGGDPTYAFNVRLTGEEVHGTSGSFRHFLGHVTRELQSSVLGLLIPCPSGAVGKNKGRYILRPGPITFPEEKMLQFFGQLLGVALRADIPLALDLLETFWKCLVGVELDLNQDLQEADMVTHQYIKRINESPGEESFKALCSELCAGHGSEVEGESPDDPYLKFIYHSMNGDEIELCPCGRDIIVSWEKRLQYTSAIKEMRLRELRSEERMLAVRCGLASVVPIQLVTMMTPTDMEIRTCGMPTVDLNFLKAHTMYQVGLVETDTHIEYFWNALESFSQEELCRFIKFACNQERIPCSCPCHDGEVDATHVPPYPMKIAPPDGASGSPDSRFIRVETCMFMIKLPQYSNQEIMTERLLYAINCREDPLSG